MIAWAEQYRSALVAEFNDKLEQGKANLENKINKLKENF
jgi:hypothetical protein